MTTVVTTREELAKERDSYAGSSVAVVMTMGALHAGHVSLVEAAREHAERVIVTVFVNPLQFGAGEDLDRYPRTLDADVEKCARAGADLVFAPTPDVVYPDQPLVRVSAGPMGDVLEGAARPGHFDGVLTVVLKLLHLTRPDVAVFGQKDAQQLALIRRMVRDLDVPVEVVGAPIVRDADGLALSSRNAYLSEPERASALALSRALREASRLSSPDAVLAAGRAVLDAEPGLVVDYLELVDPATMRPVDAARTGSAMLLVAATVGTTRLIDNTFLEL